MKNTIHIDFLDGGVLAALSGGADSVALLYALRDSKAHVMAAHLNHCLRESESDADEQFCRKLCGEMGIALAVERRDIAAERQKGEGIEECARRVRYEFLEKTAQQNQLAYVATAHNANDNAETLLMNIARGCGLGGLRCISPSRPLGAATLVRPLLDYTRCDLETYLQEKGATWVEDSTNTDTSYTRNYVRHEILPRMLAVNPRTVEHCRDLICDARRLDLPQHSALTRRHSEAICALLASRNPSCQISLPNGYTARREYQRVIIEPSATTPPPAPSKLEIGTTLWANWKITVSRTATEAQSESKFFVNALRFSDLPTLGVRQRRAGDAISPLGADWSKTIKKLLIDCKIPQKQRNCYPIVTVSDVAAATPHTSVDKKYAAQAGEDALCITFQKIGEI